MSIELKIPEVGESVREVQIGRWLKREGDAVALDENVVELETDKASMELAAPAAGVLGQILKKEGDTVTVGDVIGYVETSDGEAASAAGQNESPKKKDSVATAPTPTATGATANTEKSQQTHVADVPITPAARRALREHGLTAADVKATGPSLRRKDVLRHVDELKRNPPAAKPVETQPTTEKRERPSEH